MANWDKITSRGEVEDRRGQVVGGVASLGTIAIVGFLMFANGASGTEIGNFVADQLVNQPTSINQGEFVDTQKYQEFASTVIGSNNDLWNSELAKQGIEYSEPRLVLFRGMTESGCGGASSQSGPHYCQVDRTIYLDETFFEELTSRFGAKGGKVAEAYVMAHEVGHHIQKVQGTFAKVDTRDNSESVKVELQADCYAGLWLGSINQQGIVSEDEISQALDAAAAVGDDRIQKNTTGRVNPESWTHGSSESRKQAFLKGFKTQNVQNCNSITK